MPAHLLSLAESARQIRTGALSPVDLLEALLARIDALEPQLQAWVTLDRAGALDSARRCAAEVQRGQIRGPLHGVPVGIKDIFFTAGMRTTCGSRIFADYVPDYDATAVARLKAAGAIILGKTHTTEFATLDPAPTHNPWHLEHTPGGSSSGSGAAVGAGMVAGALGSQTAGSVLRPAAYCGTVGLKPTFGRISRYGVFPPTTPTPAPHGLQATGDPVFQTPWTFLGIPALTLPYGIAENGLPLGLQLASAPFTEARLLAVARWCERTLAFTARPAVVPD